MEPIEAIIPRRAEGLGKQVCRLAGLSRAGLPIPRAYALARDAADAIYGRVLSPDARLRSLLDPDQTLPDPARLAQLHHEVRTLAVGPELRGRIVEAYSTLRALGAPSVLMTAFVVADAPNAERPLGDVRLGIEDEDTAVSCVVDALVGLLQPAELAALRAQGARDASVVVLMQQMVDGFVSGVAYTQHPLTGDGHEWLIRAGYGLASGVRGAKVPSDFIRVSRDGFVRDRVIAQKSTHLAPTRGGGRSIQPVPAPLVSRPSLGEAGFAEVLRLAKRAERELGGPICFDWARAHGRVYLLRVEPMPGKARVPRERTLNETIRRRALWSRVELGELLPQPLSPLTWSLLNRFSRNGLASAIAASGGALGAEPELLMDVRGRAYLNLGTLAEAACRIPGLTRDVLSRIGLDLPFDFRKRSQIGPLDLARAGARIYDAHVRFGSSVQTLSSRMADEIGHFVGLDARLLSPDAVERVLCDIEAFLEEACITLMRVFGTWIATLLTLRSLFAKYLAEDAARIERDLLWGPAELVSAGAGYDLLELAAGFARDREALSWAGQQTDAPPLSVQAALAAYAQRHQHEGVLMLDPATPRWRESPAQLLGVMRALLADPTSVTLRLSRRATADVRRVRAERDWKRAVPVVLWPATKWLLKRARTLICERDRLLLDTAQAIGMLREIALDASRRFAMRFEGVGLDAAFFLTIEELHETLARGHWDLRPRIEARQIEYAQASALPTAVDRFQVRPTHERTEGEPIVGAFGGGGVAEGRVFVLRDPERLAELPPDAVLVVTACDVGLCPVLPAVRAVISEQGGVLSHGAALGAALGVPVVVGVPNALSRLGAGERVRVDADCYRVERV